MYESIAQLNESIKKNHQRHPPATPEQHAAWAREDAEWLALFPPVAMVRFPPPEMPDSWGAEREDAFRARARKNFTNRRTALGPHGDGTVPIVGMLERPPAGEQWQRRMTATAACSRYNCDNPPEWVVRDLGGFREDSLSCHACLPGMFSKRMDLHPRFEVRPIELAPESIS